MQLDTTTVKAALDRAIAVAATGAAGTASKLDDNAVAFLKGLSDNPLFIAFLTDSINSLLTHAQAYLLPLLLAKLAGGSGGGLLSLLMGKK